MLRPYEFGGRWPSERILVAHGAQAADALLDWRVGGEEVADAAAGERVDDVERGGRLGAGGLGHGARLDAVVQLGEGAGQALGVVRVAGAALVGGVLAGAREGHLEDAGGERGEDDGGPAGGGGAGAPGA